MRGRLRKDTKNSSTSMADAWWRMGSMRYLHEHKYQA